MTEHELAKLHKLEIKITEGFTTLKGQHEALSGTIGEIKEDQDKLVHTIYGNGKEGILTKLAKISDKQTIIWTLIILLGTLHMSGMDITNFM